MRKLSIHPISMERPTHSPQMLLLKRIIEITQIIYAQWIDMLPSPDMPMNANAFAPQIKYAFHSVGFWAIKWWFSSSILNHFRDALAMVPLMNLSSTDYRTVNTAACFIFAAFPFGPYDELKVFPLSTSVHSFSVQVSVACDFNWLRAIRCRCSFCKNELSKVFN